MPRQHKTLLIAGNMVAAAEALRAAGALDNGEQILVGPFPAQFNDNHVMHIFITNTTPPQLTAALLNNTGDVVDTQPLEGPLDQDYSLQDGDTTYEATIVRGANTVLTPEAITAYEDSGGSHCPACTSADLHTGTPQVDGPTAWVRVECCACGARWKDIYQFTGISTTPADWEPPQQNVRQQTL